MLQMLLIAQAALAAADSVPDAGAKTTVINVDRITVNLVIKREQAGQEFQQYYVSFWNRPRYIAATGAAFPLWENRGWRIWTPECGPFPAGGGDVRWACVFDPEGLIVEAEEYVYWISDFDVESEWPSCLWRNPINDRKAPPGTRR